MPRYNDIDEWEADLRSPVDFERDPDEFYGREDAHLEMAYEDRFVTDFDHDPMNDDIWYDGDPDFEDAPDYEEA